MAVLGFMNVHHIFSFFMVDRAGWIGLKLVSFDRSLLKREAPRFLFKSARPPSVESPLKFTGASLFSDRQVGTELARRP